MTGRTPGEQPKPEEQWPAVPGGFGPPPEPGGHGTFGPPPQPWTVAPDAGAPSGIRAGDRFKGRPAVVAVAALVALLLAIGGAYLVLGKPADPVARGDKEQAVPSGSPSIDQGDGKGPGVGRDVYDPNFDIQPGQAQVWLRDNQTRVVGGGTRQFGPWRVGDVVVKAMFKEVTAYAVADGQEKWKVSLQTPLCGAPPAPSANGKLVLGVHESDSLTSHCTDLQQVDLTTGKAGWKTTVPQENRFDTTTEFQLAITGDTVAVARTANMSGFSVTDGRKLFGTSKENGCYPTEFAGGSRLIGVRNCSDQMMIQEVDPATGVPKWSYTYDKGWNLGRVLSVDPLVVAAYHKDGKAWNITAFTADGKVRSQSDAAFGVTGRCNGWGNANGLQECYAAVADADTLYIGAGKTGKELGIDDTNQVVAVDLNTGKEKWRTAEQPKRRTMWPLAIENGRVVVYISPGIDEGGSVVSLAPADGASQPLLQSPAAAAGAEDVFYGSAVRIAWTGGRLFLLNGRVESPEPRKASRAILSFGK